MSTPPLIARIIQMRHDFERKHKREARYLIGDWATLSQIKAEVRLQDMNGSFQEPLRVQGLLVAGLVNWQPDHPRHLEIA